MYQPSEKILKRYADVLVNFALNDGRGVKRGEVVRLVVSESAKPLYMELYKALLSSGAHTIVNYLPDDNNKSFNFSRAFFENADKKQLEFFPKNYIKGMVKDIDHSIAILSEVDKHSLEGIDPKKIMSRGEALKPLRSWLDKKENEGKYTWTLGLYGTSAMAQEAGLSLENYWDQIIRACFLDKKDPVKSWKEVLKKINSLRQKMTTLPIERLHIEGEDVDLWISVGENRRWSGGSGRNIPSFEIFTSPDWRGTEGWIRFNQPLYRYGNLIEGIELEFKDGRVIKSRAKKNQKVLREMIKVEGADKVGEFSLTDKRFSRIDKFMAETLYDENIGGPQGNTHIALGKAYADCFNGECQSLKKSDWKKIGFNDSSVHTDIISTTRRKVTAYLKDGSEKVVYKDGQFTI